MMGKKELIEKIIELNEIEDLNPVQKEAIEKGILEGKNLVVASPTSSGKTLIAEMAGLNVVLNQKKKMVYLCPLVALAREKYEEFKEKYEKLGIKIALSIGDFDSADPWLQNYDWIVCSNEKMDSLVRHDAPWISQIGLIVIDEIHLLNDFSRGPTLEILITLLRELVPSAQILALSATIKNCEEIAQWLKAEILKSDFRPVPLYQGIFLDNKIKIPGKKIYFLKPGLPPEEAISENTLFLKKQLIFFLSTRRNAEALAERLAKLIPGYLDFKERQELEKLAQKIERVLEVPTIQCKKLAKCIRGGVAFYHAGLASKQKILIEEGYKKGILKVITSTTALAYGLNMPNFRAVVRDVKRFYPGMGSVFLPVLEVQQMFGRSGRPQFDKWGEGILIAKNKKEEKELERIYLKGELEEISSKISNEMALRMHILAQVASGFSRTKEELKEFFSKTFFGFKFKIYFLEEKIEEILEILENWKFIKRIEIMEDHEPKEKILATKLGKRISQLYLDPFSAAQFIEGLKTPEFKNFPLLCLISRASELKPSLNLSLKDIPEIEKYISKYEGKFLLPIPDQFEEEYEEFLREVKLALVFSNWIEEKTEGEIFEKFNVAPGELHQRLQIADWLLYSLLEIGKILYLGKEKMRKLRKLRKRLYYGIREELLKLVSLEGIGRVRARILFNSGLTSIPKLKKASLSEISKILGSKKIAKKIKEQI